MSDDRLGEEGGEGGFKDCRGREMEGRRGGRRKEVSSREGDGGLVLKTKRKKGGRCEELGKLSYCLPYPYPEVYKAKDEGPRTRA